MLVSLMARSLADKNASSWNIGKISRVKQGSNVAYTSLKSSVAFIHVLRLLFCRGMLLFRRFRAVDSSIERAQKCHRIFNA